MSALMRLYIVVFAVSIVGCKLDGGGGVAYTNTSIGERLSAKDVYTFVDKDIATKICYAFQSKRSNFVSNFNDLSFNFDVTLENLDCKIGTVSKRIETSLVARSLSEVMFYDTLLSSSEFERYLQTNAHGYLVEICDLLMKGEELPSPTTIIGNTRREVIEFVSNSDGIGFIFKEYERDWDDSAESYVLSTYDYLTVLVDQKEDKYGIILERVREKKCSNDLTEKKSQFYLP